MKARLLVVLLLVATPAAAELDTDDVLRLHRAGLETETVLAVVEASGQSFELTTEEILALKKAGIDETVIRAMIQGSASREEAASKTVVREDGTILLTNEGQARERRAAAPSPTNTVPSRGISAERTSPRPYPETRVVLPEGAAPTTAYLPPQTVVEDRGPYGIGYRWHPSWNDREARMPAFRTPGIDAFPLGADIDVSYGSAAGYFYKPAAFGPNGPSSFGRFEFHLLPSTHLHPGHGVIRRGLSGDPHHRSPRRRTHPRRHP